jgi:hypothetical protein
MRTGMIRKIALLVICVCASGCFVFDELDAGEKIMEQNAAVKPAAPAQPTAAHQTGSGWWANAKSLSDTPAEPSSDPAIACMVGKSMRFMRKSDCLSQGGRPQS